MSGYDATDHTLPLEFEDDFLPPVYIPDQMDGAVSDEFHDMRYGNVSSTTQPSIHYVNESGLPDDVIDRHMRMRGNNEIASIIEKWSQSLSHTTSQKSLDVFNRTKWGENVNHPHALMSQCAWAVENDDILSTLADVIEGLMWQKCRFELFDSDQQDFWNQWAAGFDLDSALRKQGREQFKCSQYYVGLWWERKVYSVREDDVEETIDEFEVKREQREYEDQVKQREAFIAANKGQEGFVEPPKPPEPSDAKSGKGNRKRKKKYPVLVPTAMTVLDPTKVIPVGQLMFGRERFAYIATEAEDDAMSAVFRGEIVDDMIMRLIERRYEATPSDIAACGEIGIDYRRLWLFKEDSCFRHTLTKADYERYAVPRLKPVLPLLEMKQHLRASDRATLIGNTNFIVVITKGTDKLPAKPAEIANLQEQARVIARLPVLIGDHRLKVEIVAPVTDNTLIESRWETLDSRLVFAALRTYSPVVQGGTGGGAGVSEMSRVVAKNLENLRHMVVRTLEAKVFRKILDKNEGILDEMPALTFTPKRITLDFNSDIIGQILKLRDRGDISRETTLEEIDFDQDVEVRRRARERVIYDRVFESQTPFSSPTTNPYGVSQPPPQGGNVGPNGQPRTEGGRPGGVPEGQPRAPRGGK